MKFLSLNCGKLELKNKEFVCQKILAKLNLNCRNWNFLYTNLADIKNFSGDKLVLAGKSFPFEFYLAGDVDIAPRLFISNLDWRKDSREPMGPLCQLSTVDFTELRKNLF